MKDVYSVLGVIFFTFSPAKLFDNATSALPFSQNWSIVSSINTSDSWSGVTSIEGYRGDDLTSAMGTDPQTILSDGLSTPIDVNANQTNPNSFATGGVAEFEIADPTIALQGSGTADAPFIILYINTMGLNGVRIRYDIRDIDASADNAVQQVALQYRLGTGNFINLPAGYIADAATGPGEATLVTPVDVILPAACNNQPLVQIRIITTNAVGNDEWIGIDNILVDEAPQIPLPVELQSFSGYRDRDRNILRWTTVSEHNSVGFQVERSENGIDYSVIGFINSRAGVNDCNGCASTLNYSFHDNNLTGNGQYYRLRQIDVDSHEKLSNIILIKSFKPEIFAISGVFPNPAKMVINVIVETPNPDKVIFILSDMNGRDQKQLVAFVETGTNTIPIDISNFRRGIYFIRIISSTKTSTNKFIKQ